MKARMPSRELYNFYDKVIAKNIEAIAELTRYEEKTNEIYLGIKYDDTIESKFLFQLAKIYCNCVKGRVILFVECSRKNFRELKKQNSSLNLVKLNIFNQYKPIFIIRSKYLQINNKKLFEKEHYYSDDLIEKIWDEYYEVKVEQDDDV